MRVLAEGGVVKMLEGMGGPQNCLMCQEVTISTRWECMTEEHVVKKIRG